MRKLALKKFLLTSIAALFLAIGTVHATDELKADDLFHKLYEECGEQEGIPGAIAVCVLEKEKAFGKELEQVYKKALALAGANDTLLRESQKSWLKYQGSACKCGRSAGKPGRECVWAFGKSRMSTEHDIEAAAGVTRDRQHA